jgi:uncharacterized protein YcaQ
LINPIRTNLAKVRSFVLQKQLLNTARTPKSKRGVFETISRLGYIQIDTIHVIERSHHLVLHARIPDYKKQFLHDLQAKDRKIFEYWAHAASFIPIDDYRFYIRKMREKPKKDSWSHQWVKKYNALVKKVKKRIEKEGPLSASDFPDVKNRKRGPWWDWKPAKAALEILFWRGELMIKERKNFTRVYDLTERVLPSGINTTLPDIAEEKEFFIQRALKGLGIASIQDINKYIGISGRLNAWLARLLKKNVISEVVIKGLNKPYYILSNDLPEFTNYKARYIDRVCFLSPFDNAVILRDRTAALFGFDYSLECYVPKAKRKYGYFCLPVLWHNRFVGRIDMKAERQSKTMLINNFYLDDAKLGSTFYRAFNSKLLEFSIFHGCQKIKTKNIPDTIKKYITV